MNEKVQKFQVEFSEAANEFQKFCFMTRAKELQLEACTALETLRSQASKIKQEVIHSQDEDAANAMLSFEEMIDALLNELRMWVALKEDAADAAWNYLVSAQYAARTAMQAHSVANHLNGYVNHLYMLEQVLFPPLGFLSPGVIIEQSKCSICGQEYGECEHIVGKAYMGEICLRIIEKIKEVKEFSLVSEPANKRARIVRLTDENGILRDVMTWRVVPKPGE
ncbi:MAG TPA: hypothetical protein VNG51_13855 [Ktedonobacteraceae bacterium]|nr:hypothetical protein [Ktedonobacteraceae bacterium]